VTAGNSTQLTVAVIPGSNPTSTGITVVGDLTSIGGSATQMFFDDGTNGDTTSGDNTFSFVITVAAATTPGAKNLPVVISDAQARTGNANISLTVTGAPVTGQPLPFSQSWTDTTQINANNIWSGVPGIVGYLGDFSPDANTGVDPQTLLQDFSTTQVNVTANQTDPTALISGGLAEFELADPVVAFQGSGTADAPHIVISLNTTGATNIAVSYLLRDVDASSDNSIQPVALQYRIGSSGNYTNIPGAFVADASSGPGTATLVTPVAVILPTEANNQPLVQLRIMTTNANQSDEWIGIDNINVQSNGTIPLSATGAAAPGNVEAGTSTLLTVRVNPATNPSSTGITVVGDLTSIGGSATQMFFDNGTNGDVTPGDNVFSFSALVPVATSTGSKVLPISVSDAQARTASTSIGLVVSGTSDPQVHLTMGNPSNATTDVSNPTNYLLVKSQYVMSYHRDRGIPNWVSWHLDSSWLGSAPRQDDFRADPSLPAGWYQVTETDYSGSGFDRGHHTPSADRTRSIPDNSATFFMTNMMPQAPFNNQGPWEELESYCRTLVQQGNELYIIAGGTGQGGSGSAGGITNTVANGHVVVPAFTWKVIIVLPSGADDLNRVYKTTRVIAVIMPNRQDIGINTPWRNFRTSVDRVEGLTGLDFFSNVKPQIQTLLERKVDSQ
jgi:endonuclease G